VIRIAEADHVSWYAIPSQSVRRGPDRKSHTVSAKRSMTAENTEETQSFLARHVIRRASQGSVAGSGPDSPNEKPQVVLYGARTEDRREVT